MSHDFPLPPDLPEPEDDGGSDHLEGIELPNVSLIATDETSVNLQELPSSSIVYIYPLTGRPDEDVLPDGWSDIPGARGCTPESCGFRNHYDELQENGVKAVFGLSTQPIEYQREVRDRLRLPFELLSDVEWQFANELRLPKFTIKRDEYLKRLTLIISDNRIEHVYYPVFPPDEHASEVVQWVKNNPR